MLLLPVNDLPQLLIISLAGRFCCLSNRFIDDDYLLSLEWRLLDDLDLLGDLPRYSLSVDDRLQAQDVMSERRQLERKLVQTGLGETQQFMNIELGQVKHILVEAQVGELLRRIIEDGEAKANAHILRRCNDEH